LPSFCISSVVMIVPLGGTTGLLLWLNGFSPLP